MTSSRRRSLCAAAALAACLPFTARPAARKHRLAGVGWHPKWDLLAPYFERLSELGISQGRNLEMGWFFPRKYPIVTDEELGQRARDAIAWRPDAIVTFGLGNSRRLRSATTTIPVVFGMIEDPVADGLVASLSHPGGNITGAALSGDALAMKRLELVRELVPAARRVGVTFFRVEADPARTIQAMRAIAPRIGLDLVVVDLSSAAGGVEAGLRRFEGSGVQAIVPLGFTESAQVDAESRLVAFQEKARAPIVDWITEAVDTGAVCSLGEQHADHLRRMADVTAVVLDGRASVDRIPVSATSRVHLSLNRAVARRMGIEVSPAVLARADRIVG
jgi:putative ABC transport system substrate-binding protein